MARERYDISKLEKISSGGSDRDVYAIGKTKVLKIAKTARGLLRNESLMRAIIGRIYEEPIAGSGKASRTRRKRTSYRRKRTSYPYMGKMVEGAMNKFSSK